MRNWSKAALCTASAFALAFILMSCAAFERKDCSALAGPDRNSSAELEALRQMLNGDNAEHDYVRALKELRAYLMKQNGHRATEDLARAKDVLAMLEALKAAQDRAEAAQKKNAELSWELKALKDKDEKDEEEMKLLRDQINKLQLLDIEMEKKRKNLR